MIDASIFIHKSTTRKSVQEIYSINHGLGTRWYTKGYNVTPSKGLIVKQVSGEYGKKVNRKKVNGKEGGEK